jgi:hypothetical protein
MFEVVEVGPAESKRWGKPKYRTVKLKALNTAFTEKLTRSFEGHGNYSNQVWRADFPEGSSITIWLPISDMTSVGDRLSVDALAGQGRLEAYFRCIRIS